MSSKTKAAYISLSGLPNAGKSTLLNTILQQKLNAVSAKPQTTRDNILGILNIASTQLVFMDTPGFNKTDKAINKYLLKEAIRAYNDADIVVYLFDFENKNFKFKKDDDYIKSILETKGRENVIPILSKIDLASKQDITEAKNIIKEKFGLENILSISSLKSIGLSDLLNTLKAKSPIHPFYFPEDILTDKDLRFLVAEIIREKIFIYTKEELPYSVAVQILKFEEKENIDKIFAEIIVEKETQKPIILGKKGSMIKQIGVDARKDIEELTEKKAYLNLFVKVRKNWTKKDLFLKEFGYKG